MSLKKRVSCVHCFETKLTIYLLVCFQNIISKLFALPKSQLIIANCNMKIMTLRNIYLQQLTFVHDTTYGAHGCLELIRAIDQNFKPVSIFFVLRG